MRKDDPGAFKADGVADDRADRDGDRIGAAVVTGEMNAMRLVIDMGDEQALLLGASEAGSEKGPARFDAVQCNRRFGTLKHGPTLGRWFDRSQRKRVRFGPNERRLVRYGVTVGGPEPLALALASR